MLRIKAFKTEDRRPEPEDRDRSLDGKSGSWLILTGNKYSGLFASGCLLRYCLYLMLAVMVACVPEEEMVSSQPDNPLVFSGDTVLFDTIFSTVESITQYIQVYNPNKNAVSISSITLAGGTASAYQLYVNGRQGTRFENLQLLGNDSLLLLVEVKIDRRDEDLPFLVEDSILFATGSYAQDVKLIAWGQDAHFLKGLVIQQDTTFTSDRPYVIFDSLNITQPSTLRMEAGTRVYFHTGSGLLVDGTLLIEGTPEEPVLLRSNRQDGRYKFSPGQWRGIFFSELSKNNKIDHAIIRNGVAGVVIQGNDADTIPDITIANTEIRNMANFGILSVDADVDAYNLLIDSCAYNLVQHLGNGYCRYVHCTFNNNYPLGIDPALFFADTTSISSNDSQPFDLTLTNNIIWGVRRDELIVYTEKADSRVTIASNLIRTRNAVFQDKNLLNQDPQFINPYKHNYQLDSVSVAIDTGIVTLVKKDITGNLRDSLPDLGAYEYVKKR